jgi:dTDP-4-amino-4,6-dideoxygalactose transaminase
LFAGENGIETADRWRKILERGGVITEPCYTPLHLRAEGKSLRRTAMPVCESVWQRVFAVPVRPDMQSRDWRNIEMVVSRAVSLGKLQ